MFAYNVSKYLMNFDVCVFIFFHVWLVVCLGDSRKGVCNGSLMWYSLKDILKKIENDRFLSMNYKKEHS